MKYVELLEYNELLEKITDCLKLHLKVIQKNKRQFTTWIQSYFNKK